MNRIFSRSKMSIALGALLLLSAFFMVATESVSAEQESDFTFMLDSNITANAIITGYTGPGGSITIPSTLFGFPVIGIGEWAFAYSPLTSVFIAEGITSIYEGAFYASTSLTQVTLPASVSYIGPYTFESCSSLTTITFLEMNAPHTGADWIDDTSENIIGHAYSDSNFPAPGGIFNGLTMGQTISEGTVVSDDGISMIWWAFVVVLVIAIALFSYFGRKERKETAPSQVPPVQWTANEANTNRKGITFNRVRAQAPPPRNQFDQPLPLGQSHGHCPWCGAQTTDSPYCGYCGGKLKR